ncbi:META domain-containing protein [Apibacter muscae]|uniref:META domain-containing protein n=1 Tax=Apibacter muscae TaxID=2509004 RepID=A0A563DHT6_9FLAO|nr:META domain-containing protein [Apibacter muscae]TWP30966.1 META domain-containing protein [Apibacter muscae]
MNIKILSLSLLLSVFLFSFSCSSNNVSVEKNMRVEKINPVNAQIQENQVWVLQKIDGEDAKNVFDNLPTLSFDVLKKRVSGNSGCNRYSGSYLLDEENHLDISQVITTRMFCDNKNNESGFVTNLDQANLVKIENNTLTFLKDDDALLEFKLQ